VASHRTDGTGTNAYYTVPTTREAGIWTPPGPTITPNGNLLVAAGNGASTTTYDGSDAVIELNPSLQFVRRFFPASWQDDNRFDRDLGSTGPAFVSSGGRDFVVQVGKTPTAYVLNRSNLSLAHSGAVCGAGKGAFGGSAVGGSTVYEPCDDGVRAIAIDASGNPRVLWRANGGDGTNPMGSPVIYQGSVLATNRNNGTLYALNPANGQTTARLAVGTVTRFATPALDTNRAYVGTTSGVVAVALG
jgi:outer membrane protein assembly factor BamB